MGLLRVLTQAAVLAVMWVPIAGAEQKPGASAPGRGVVSGKLAPNTVSRWEGTLTRDTSKSASGSSTPKAPAETVAFTVTTNGAREPTSVNLQFTAATATLSAGNELQCFTGGNVTGQATANSLFIIPADGDGFFFSYSDLTGEAFFNGVNGGGILEGLTFDFDTGLPIDLDINQAQGQVNFQYQFSLESDQFCTEDSPAPGGTCSLPCSWFWEAECIENCDGNGQVQFAQAAYEIDETEDAVEVVVRRVEGAIGEVTVDYQTAIIGGGKGNAASGIDYQFTSGTFTWMDGEADDKMITIPILDDTVIEGPEDFRVELSNVTGGAELGDPMNTIVTIEDRPDLTIDEFMVDTGTLVRENGRYLLKDIEVFVRNVAEGGQAATNVVITVTDNASFQVLSPGFGPLEPGEASEDPFVFDYDLTSVLSAGAGVASFELTATADAADTIPERDPDTINSFTETGDVDVRPKILNPVQAIYDVDGAFFLDRPLTNEITVRVDWNGENLPGIGEQPFGQVLFTYNTEDAIEIDGNPNAIGTLIQDDFINTNMCDGNSFVFGARLDNFEAEPVSWSATLFDFPTWVLWLIDFIPGVDSDFTVMPKPGQGVVVYDYNFIFPDPAFELTATVPEFIPYVGGLTGVTETQATVKARYDSSDKGNVSVSGQTGITAAGKVATVELKGEGQLKYNCVDSQLGLGETTIGLKLGAGISIEKGLIEIFPLISSATQWPVVGSAIKWLTDIAKVTAMIVPQAGVTLTFEPDDAGAINFTKLAGQLGLMLQATLALEPFDSVTAFITGGGSIAVEGQLPPPLFQEAMVSLLLSVGVEVWGYGGTFTTEAQCTVPGACTVDNDFNAFQLVGQLRLLPRDYLNSEGYARFTRGLQQHRGVSAGDRETVLVTNTYPRPAPHLAMSDSGQRLVLYVHDDPNDPDGRSTEIRSMLYDGAQWQAPINVVDDLQPDFAPSVAYDSSNSAVAVWERSTLPEGQTPEFIDETFAQSLEIYSAVWNGSGWSAAVALTDNDEMDHAPSLIQGSDGSIMAVWKNHAGFDMTGTADRPVTFRYATYNGGTWDPAMDAVGSLDRVLQFDVAARNANEATLVMTRDGGTGDFTETGTDIFYSTFDGLGWSALARLTNNSVSDQNPAVAYDASGARHLLWVRNGELMWLRDSLSSTQAQVIRSESTAAGILDFRVVNDASGNLAIAWPSASVTGTNTAYLIYDQAAGRWGQDLVLQNNFAVEGFTEMAFAPDGSLQLVYAKTAIAFEEREIGQAPNTTTISQLAVPGQTDLAHFEHVLGIDAVAEQMTFEPTNVQQGDDYTLAAVVRNAGDFELGTVEVQVFDNNGLIHSETLSDLGSGESATVSVDGVMSEAQQQAFRLVVDPNAALAEKDETNNELITELTGPAFEVFFRDGFQFDR